MDERMNKTDVTLTDVLTDNAIELLKGYDWRGNVREIINIVEYIRYLYEGKPLSIDELPDYLIQSGSSIKEIMLDKPTFLILKWISEYHGIGRKRLSQLCKTDDLNLGEGKIRKLLEQLKEDGLITIGEEARGCVITEQGSRV